MTFVETNVTKKETELLEKKVEVEKDANEKKEVKVDEYYEAESRQFSGCGD